VVLCWAPLLIALLLSLWLLISTGQALFDYLLPAELYVVAIPGGVLVLVAAILAVRRRAATAVALGLAIAGLVGSQATATATGLATGAIAAEGWPWFAVIALLVLYLLALVALGAIGVLLLRGLRRVAGGTAA
jgi:hypothetical protein